MGTGVSAATATVWVRSWRTAALEGETGFCHFSREPNPRLVLVSLKPTKANLRELLGLSLRSAGAGAGALSGGHTRSILTFRMRFLLSGLVPDRT